ASRNNSASVTPCWSYSPRTSTSGTSPTRSPYSSSTWTAARITASEATCSTPTVSSSVTSPPTTHAARVWLTSSLVGKIRTGRLGASASGSGTLIGCRATPAARKGRAGSAGAASSNGHQSASRGPADAVTAVAPGAI